MKKLHKGEHQLGNFVGNWFSIEKSMIVYFQAWDWAGIFFLVSSIEAGCWED